MPPRKFFDEKCQFMRIFDFECRDIYKFDKWNIELAWGAMPPGKWCERVVLWSDNNACGCFIAVECCIMLKCFSAPDIFLSTFFFGLWRVFRDGRSREVILESLWEFSSRLPRINGTEWSVLVSPNAEPFVRDSMRARVFTFRQTVPPTLREILRWTDAINQFSTSTRLAQISQSLLPTDQMSETATPT